MTETIEIFKRTGKVKTWLEYAYDLGLDTEDLTNKQLEDKARKLLSKYNSNTNMKVAKYTHRDETGSYTTYVEKKEEDQSLEDKLTNYQSLIDSIQLTYNKLLRNSNTTKTGVVSFADLHYGLVNKEYSKEEAERRLQFMVDEVNKLDYSHVHLIFDGDFAESFTGLNKRDTWKNISLIESQLVTSSYELMLKVVSSIFNIESVTILAGNHDRYSPDKERSYKDSYLKVVSYFLEQKLNNYNIEVNYSESIITKVIDNINYICTHGDENYYKNYSTFLLEYGTKENFNVLLTGHLHEFKILHQSSRFIHVQLPAVVGNTPFGIASGYSVIPGFIEITNSYGLPKIVFHPIPGK